MSVLSYHKLAGYKYRVAALFTVSLPELTASEIATPWFTVHSGELTVFPGYAWDGCSGPTLDTPSTMIPGLVHDVLYQCMRSGLLSPEHRQTADAILRRLMLDPALSSQNSALSSLWSHTRAAYYYRALRLFGANCIKPRATEPQSVVYTAP